MLRENRLANENFKGIHGYRSVLRSRLGDDADYSGQNEDDDDDDDEEGDEKSGLGDEKPEEDEEEEEEDDENSDEAVNESETGRYYDYG